MSPRLLIPRRTPVRLCLQTHKYMPVCAYMCTEPYAVPNIGTNTGKSLRACVYMQSLKSLNEGFLSSNIGRYMLPVACSWRHNNPCAHTARTSISGKLHELNVCF